MNSLALPLPLTALSEENESSLRALLASLEIKNRLPGTRLSSAAPLKKRYGLALSLALHLGFVAGFVMWEKAPAPTALSAGQEGMQVVELQFHTPATSAHASERPPQGKDAKPQITPSAAMTSPKEVKKNERKAEPVTPTPKIQPAPVTPPATVMPRAEKQKIVPQPRQTSPSPLPSETASISSAAPEKASFSATNGSQMAAGIPNGSPSASPNTAPSASAGAEGIPTVTRARFKSPPSPPEYPRRAQRLRQQGTVMIELLVHPGGSQEQWRILRSSGHPLLDEAALKAVRGWEILPDSRGGREVTTKVQIPVVFQLPR
jgi:protein TonB